MFCSCQRWVSKKKVWMVHGWGELYPVLLGFVLTFQSPLPGPTPSTVFEPGAICVRPASRITLIVKPSALACSASCSLQRRRHVFRSRLKTSLQFRRDFITYRCAIDFNIGPGSASLRNRASVGRALEEGPRKLYVESE